MRKRKIKPYCSIGVSSSVSCSKMVDDLIYPIIEKAEKEMKIVAKKEKLHISGIIYIYTL